MPDDGMLKFSRNDLKLYSILFLALIYGWLVPLPVSVFTVALVVIVHRFRRGRRRPEIQLDPGDVGRLRERERMLSHAQHTAQVGSYCHDLGRDETIFSDELYRLLGYEPGECSPNFTLLVEHIHPEDRDTFLAHIRTLGEAGASYDYEHRITSKDGRVKTVRSTLDLQRDDAGHPTRQIGAMQDITARKRAEEESAANRGIMEAAIAQSPSGIVIADAPNVSIRLANAAAFGIRGSESDGLLGIDFEEHTKTWQLFRPDGTPYPPEELPLSRAVMHGEITWGVDIIMRDAEGEDHWLSTNSGPIRGANGDIIGGVTVFHDVTRNRKVEAELVAYQTQLENLVSERTRALEEAQDELVRNERMALLGRLTATVSHEMRNPLGTIRSSLFLIAKRTAEAGVDTQTPVARAERSIDRCVQIIEELLGYTEYRPMEQRPTEMGQWMEEVLSLCAIPEGLSMEVGPLAPTMLALDQTSFERCITSLLRNGCESMLDDRGIAIRATHTTLHVSTQVVGQRYEVLIQDRGRGIRSEDLERVFEPLYSTKGFGAGLGLPLAKDIMTLLNGGIEIDSTPDVGTLCTVWLPLDDI